MVRRRAMISIHTGWPKDGPPPYPGKIEFEVPVTFVRASKQWPPSVVGFAAFKLVGIKTLSNVPVLLCAGKRKGVIFPCYMQTDGGDWVSFNQDQRADIAVAILDCPEVVAALNESGGRP